MPIKSSFWKFRYLLFRILELERDYGKNGPNKTTSFGNDHLNEVDVVPESNAPQSSAVPSLTGRAFDHKRMSRTTDVNRHTHSPHSLQTTQQEAAQHGLIHSSSTHINNILLIIPDSSLCPQT
jgi:hypothetical protein